MCVLRRAGRTQEASHPMDVMDGGADNSSPLIKAPSYRYDLRSNGEVCSLGGDRPQACWWGCAASVKQVYAESPTGSAKYGTARKD